MKGGDLFKAEECTGVTEETKARENVGRRRFEIRRGFYSFTESGQFFRRIGNNPTAYKNALPLINHTLLWYKEVKYVHNVIVSIDIEKIGMRGRRR